MEFGNSLFARQGESCAGASSSDWQEAKGQGASSAADRGATSGPVHDDGATGATPSSPWEYWKWHWDYTNKRWQAKGIRVGAPEGGSETAPGLHTASNKAAKARKLRNEEKRKVEDAADPEGAEGRAQARLQMRIDNKIVNLSRKDWLKTATAAEAAEEAKAEAAEALWAAEAKGSGASSSQRQPSPQSHTAQQRTAIAALFAAQPPPPEPAQPPWKKIGADGPAAGASVSDKKPPCKTGAGALGASSAEEPAEAKKIVGMQTAKYGGHPPPWKKTGADARQPQNAPEPENAFAHLR